MATASDPFARFLAAYPARDEPHDEARTRDAWARAIERGADPETIILAALAYARAREGQPARYTMTARRWLSEGRWRDVPRPPAPVAPALHWVAYGSPEWRAWAAYRGKSPPIDKRGGWRFPARWPPATDEGEAA